MSQYPATSHTFIRREIEALREAGAQVDTFSIRPPSEAERSARVDREEFERTHYVLPPKPLSLLRAHAKQFRKRPRAYLETLREATRHRVPGVKASMWSLFHFAEAVGLADELERRGVDHLHNHFANSGANVGLLASRLLGLEWSLTLHGISEFDYPAGNLLAEKITAASFVACVTYFGRAQAMRLVDPVHWDKLFVARCGLDLQGITQVEASAPVPAKRRALRVVSVGRISPEKGHVGLVQAFAEVVAGGVDAELRLVGDGPTRGVVEAEVTRLGLGDRVSFAGRVPSGQVIAELLHADAFAMSSFMEGLPVVIMEALAMGVPVVAPVIAGIPELVVHGESGLLFPASDWSALGRELSKLLSDPALGKRLATEGRRRVEAEFDIHHAIAPLMERLGVPKSATSPETRPSP